MTDEERQRRIIELMNEQAKLVSADEAGEPRHREVVNELMELLIEPLREAFEGKRHGLEHAGLQLTEMIHNFFFKLLEGRVKDNGEFASFLEVKKLVATVIQHEFLDVLKLSNGRRKHAALAAEAERKRKYFEERYQTKFQAFMLQLGPWEATGTDEQKLAAQVLRFRYVTGETWARIAELFGISDRQCLPQRELAKQAFGGKL